MLKIAIPNTLPVPRQNSIRSENGTILPPHSVIESELNHECL
jgi:hypothetical protein